MKETFNFTPFPQLESKRLLFRKLKEGDNQEIFFLRTDESVNRYIERKKPNSINEAREFILNVNNGIKKNKWIYWAISLRDSENLIGTICLWNFSKDKSKAELGFELIPQYHGKGIMNEALETILEFSLSTISLTSIDAYTHRDNISSIKLLKKHNFELNTDLVDNENSNNIIFTLSKQ